jgi:hypothetical protein
MSRSADTWESYRKHAIHIRNKVWELGGEIHELPDNGWEREEEVKTALMEAIDALEPLANQLIGVFTSEWAMDGWEPVAEEAKVCESCGFLTLHNDGVCYCCNPPYCSASLPE